MGGRLLARLLQGVATLVVVATLAFVLVRAAPGDPFSSLEENPLVPREVVARQRALAGVDRPVAEQYARWLANLARGELGWSWSQARPAADAIGDALPNTLLLVGTALALGLALGIALGVAQARRRGTVAGRVLDAATTTLAAVPEFWLAIVLMLVFAHGLRLFPVAGMIDVAMHDYLGPAGRLADRLRHLVLPALSLALLFGATVARYQRAALLDVLPEDFVRAARARGLPERRVVLRHALRNALLPTVTLAGLALPALVGGAVFVETIYAWPGMGRLAVEALQKRDYDVVTAIAMLGTLLVVLGAFLADAVQARLDPRVREG